MLDVPPEFAGEANGLDDEPGEDEFVEEEPGVVDEAGAALAGGAAFARASISVVVVAPSAFGAASGVGVASADASPPFSGADETAPSLAGAAIAGASSAAGGVAAAGAASAVAPEFVASDLPPQPPPTVQNATNPREAHQTFRVFM